MHCMYSYSVGCSNKICFNQICDTFLGRKGTLGNKSIMEFFFYKFPLNSYYNHFGRSIQALVFSCLLEKSHFRTKRYVHTFQ